MPYWVFKPTLPTLSEYHQHFTSSFMYQSGFFLLIVCARIFLSIEYYKKTPTKNVMKLTQDIKSSFFAFVFIFDLNNVRTYLPAQKM